jgi:hypothetical protein
LLALRDHQLARSQASSRQSRVDAVTAVRVRAISSEF